MKCYDSIAFVKLPFFFFCFRFTTPIEPCITVLALRRRGAPALTATSNVTGRQCVRPRTRYRTVLKQSLRRLMPATTGSLTRRYWTTSAKGRLKSSVWSSRRFLKSRGECSMPVYLILLSGREKYV